MRLYTSLKSDDFQDPETKKGLFRRTQWCRPWIHQLQIYILWKTKNCPPQIGYKRCIIWKKNTDRIESTDPSGNGNRSSKPSKRIGDGKRFQWASMESKRVFLGSTRPRNTEAGDWLVLLTMPGLRLRFLSLLSRFLTLSQLTNSIPRIQICFCFR